MRKEERLDKWPVKISHDTAETPDAQRECSRTLARGQANSSVVAGPLPQKNMPQREAVVVGGQIYNTPKRRTKSESDARKPIFTHTFVGARDKSEKTRARTVRLHSRKRKL